MAELVDASTQNRISPGVLVRFRLGAPPEFGSLESSMLSPALVGSVRELSFPLCPPGRRKRQSLTIRGPRVQRGHLPAGPFEFGFGARLIPTRRFGPYARFVPMHRPYPLSVRFEQTV